jgi:hypothetical protein
MCTANLVDKANNPEADFASLLFAYMRVCAYKTAVRRFDLKKTSPFYVSELAY